MKSKLDMSVIPKYEYSSFRTFFEGEHHISRICPESVLVIVLSGILKFEENGREIDVCAGEYYIQRAGLRQTGIRKSELPRYYYIHFSAAEYADGEGLAIKGLANTDELLPLLTRLDKAYITGASAIVCEELFLRVLTKLYASAERSQEETLAEKTARYIEERINERFKISDVAAYFGYTDDYLIRSFRKYYGMTPYDYLISLRISSAKQLLLTTNRSITQIALECGWTDTASFHKAFVARNGAPPAAWRRKQRAQNLAAKNIKN